MAYKTSRELHHHFPKLAEESGFSFNTHRSRVQIDWSKIRLINIENLIRERKFIVIEQHLNDILECVLESEFDVRILDEGVMKMFRLAQLTIEYQQFCRHYLDRCVYVLREEISSLAQELDTTKKELREKDDQIKKLRRRMRQTFKTTLPYGNDNIASMILKTFTNRNDVFLPSSNEGKHHYNKCTYCDKVFLNQLYLQSHMTRRHNDILSESPKKDEQENQQIENIKLGNEILELKTKLKEMEVMITNKNNQNDPITKELPKNDTNKDECEPIIVRETRDAEVATNNDDYLINKIEEWKKEEHEKYSKEINMLRNQIMDTINSFKENEIQKPVLSDIKSVDQLQTTIIQQGAEILALKKELEISRITTENENAEKKKQAEAQILLWTKRAETQSKQYELLLQKLNEVAKDSQQSRALVETEKERSAHLQFLIQQSNANTTTSDIKKNTSNHAKISREKSIYKKPDGNNIQKTNNIKKNCEKINDRKYLEHLHRKAQELLNIDSTGSTSSDSSSVVKSSTKELIKDSRIQKENLKSTNVREPEPKSNHVKDLTNEKTHNTLKIKEKEFKKVKSKLDPEITTVENTITPGPGSPMKVVRAKLVEEVNIRLVAAGVDPLKNGIPKNIFQKQKRQLLLQQELKSKKNSAHEKVRHSILTYLDSCTTNAKKEVTQINDYISPRKLNKPLRNLTSVISNVKNKALSLVKLNETNIKDKRKSLKSKVTKRAMSLLKTPPDSTTSSPLTQRHSPLKIIMADNAMETKAKNKIESKTIHENNKNSHSIDIKERDKDSVSENTSTESDHKYYNSASINQQSSKSIENLIKSPVQRPTSANLDYSRTVNKYTIHSGDNNITRTQSETYISELKPKLSKLSNNSQPIYNENSSDDVESMSGAPFKNIVKDENIENNMKQTKSVLKNASSTSSLNKKKVLFDMDAIQMKSVSASPSQSTEKSDCKETYELGIVNLDGEEWDISSIENEVLKNDTKIQINTRTSPKIAELKQAIESQLARRNVTSASTLVGGVDVLAGPIPRAASVGGSNTSLGSSILDDSESIPVVNHIAFVKPKKVTEKDDSDVDISEFSIDGIGSKP